MEIKNKEFRKAMKEAGLESIILDKDDSCFSIFSNNEDMALRISLMDTSLIMVPTFKSQSISKWVHDIKSMLDSVSDEEIEDVKNFDLDKPIIIKERW